MHNADLGRCGLRVARVFFWDRMYQQNTSDYVVTHLP